MFDRRVVTLIVVWLALCGAAFVTLFAFHSTEELSAFVLGMLALQAPAFMALLDAPVGRPLEAGRAVIIGVIGAIVAAYQTFAIASTFALPASVIGLGFLVIGILLSVVLAIVPHPFGGRIAFSLMLLISLLAGVVTVISADQDPSLYVAVSCTIPWPAPLLVLCWPRKIETAPVVRVVR